MGTLTDRLNGPPEDRRTTDLTPVVERRSGERVPRWIERMQNGDLKAKDLTGRVAA